MYSIKIARNQYYNPSVINFLFASFLYLSVYDRKYNSVDAAVTLPSRASLLKNVRHNITRNMPDEQRLFYTLMNGYERAVRPTKKASDAIVVKLGITLTQIMDIVSHQMRLS